MARKLIINADDFGLTPSVSKGILHAHRNGIVTSTSVLVNLISPEDCESLRTTSSLGAGVHLTLTKGQPVLPSNRIPHLVDEDGLFYQRKSKQLPINENGMVLFNDIPHEQIVLEFEAQIEKLGSFEIMPTHLDTHHHIHAHPIILDAVIQLAKKYQLPVRSINSDIKQKLIMNGVRTSDNFEGNFFGIDSINQSKFLSLIDNLNDGITELMCHPGELSVELKEISGYFNERKDEMNVLIDPNVTDHIRSTGIELINWLCVML